MKKKRVIAIACCLAAMACSTANADIITWGSSNNMSPDGVTFNDSFISTNGTLVEAYNLGADTDVVLNGVTFTGLIGGGVGDLTVTTSNHRFFSRRSNPNAFEAGADNSASSEFDGTNVGTAIQSGFWHMNAVSFINLTPGYTYEIQILANDARDSRQSGFQLGLTDGETAGVVAATMNLNNSPDGTNVTPPPATEAGDWITGTFTVGSTGVIQTQLFGSTDGINFGPHNGQSQINAIQLRLTAVPEPSSALLIGLAGTVCLLRRRK